MVTSVKRIEVSQTECTFGATGAGCRAGCTVDLQFRVGKCFLREMREYKKHVDNLDADERDDDATDTIDKQIAAK